MMLPAARILALSAFLALTVNSANAVSDTPAKVLFGAARDPAVLAARSIGSYARGCLAGAIALPVTGPTWQVMRLSRNRNWGNPMLVEFLEKLAGKAPAAGWKGLLVGDLAQPRGGPMLTGHASHQIGLDADIWLTQMPPRELTVSERETISATSMLDKTGKAVDPAIFKPAQFNIIRLAASQRGVDRIFVNPAIKKALCRMETGNRSWLRVVRPWYGHDFHFHIRLGCPKGDASCKPQADPPSGDGCGQELDSWFIERPKAEPQKPEKPPRPVTLADLPPACAKVLVAK
jgi:penicillin-insensitive murein endopeptidase